ncbi:MAG TPA: hypothetical protein VF062_22940 [Candidatus Limnocylindrales bacterium]
MIVLTRILTALVCLVTAQLIAAPPAHAAPPLGKQNWVVSTSGFRTDAFRNYLRLGYIVFNGTTNAVEHNFWTWNQADHPLPIPSGDVYYCGSWVPGTNPRNNCAIKTAPGFTGNPNGRFTGTYSYNPATAQVAITWTSSTINGGTTAVNLAETWNVSAHGTGLARMALATDNYSLTGGIGHGSNASLAVNSKASMAAVRATTATYLLEGQTIHNGVMSNWTRGGAGGLTMSNWNLCDDGSCLGMVQNNAGCGVSSCCAPGPNYEACAARLAASNRRFYYLSNAFGGRRNTYEFWCECLSYDGCYQLNSHVRPLLQVIDDAGGFRGWVGAEVSPDRTAPRTELGEPYASFALVA